MKNNEIINLDGIQPFAKGGRRQVFVHPENPTRCIKILIPEASRNPAQQIYRSHSLYFIKGFFKPFDENLREWRAYLNARAMKDGRVWNHLPRCYGFAETDLGLGLVVELLRHDNGDIATPLDQRLQSGADDSFWGAWAEFKEFILQSGFYGRGLYNVLSIRQNGRERFYFAEYRTYNRLSEGWIAYFARKRRKQLKQRRRVLRGRIMDLQQEINEVIFKQLSQRITHLEGKLTSR